VNKTLFTNCLDVLEDEQGLYPIRFTPGQMAFYGKNRDRRVRSFCPSGATINFVTDAAWFELDYKILEGARNWHFFDVEVNGVLTDYYGSDTLTPVGTFRQSLIGRPNTFVTLNLPHLINLRVSGFRLSPGARALPAPRPARTLLCMGDSITQGISAQHPSNTYPSLLATHFGTGLINQGVGGWIYHPDSLDPAFPFKPDLITAAYGTNDWYFCDTLDEIREDCGRFLDGLLTIFPGTPVLVITPFWRADHNAKRPAGSFETVIETIKNECRKRPAIYTAEGMKLIPHRPEVMADGKLHPNDEGFLHIALNLAAAIRKMGLL
jgi:lysophospholipase L1-like esterase